MALPFTYEPFNKLEVVLNHLLQQEIKQACYKPHIPP